MQVFKSSGLTGFYCIALSSVEEIYRGDHVVSTQKPLQVPVGEGVLGRVLNLFGELKDKKGEVKFSQIKSIFQKSPGYLSVSSKQRVLETGIKVLDLFAPLVKGGKTGLFGGAGVGKTILLTEILHNIVNKDKEKTVSVFCGV